MQDNKEEKILILKNIISFIISLCPIYNFIIFIVYLRINGLYLESDLADYLVALHFIYLILLMSVLIAIPAFCFNIKYIIDMIKKKKKIFIAIIEIIIYILIIIFLVIIHSQSTWKGGF